MQLLFFSAIFATLLAVSTVRNQPDSSVHTSLASTNIPIDSSKWMLAKIHDGAGTTEINSAQAFIRFDTGKGKAGGKGGCNTFGSTLSVSGDSIRITHLFSTQMYCEEMQATENRFFSQLRQVTRYEIRGNLLLLFTGDNPVLELKHE